jgi:hypothetical protein
MRCAGGATSRPLPNAARSERLARAVTARATMVATVKPLMPRLRRTPALEDGRRPGDTLASRLARLRRNTRYLSIGFFNVPRRRRKNGTLERGFPLAHRMYP